MPENKNTSFVLDPWKNYEHLIGINESKAATMHNYRKALFFSKIPKIERKKKNDLVVMGTGLYLKLDQSLRQKTHVVISARDILKDYAILVNLRASFTLDLSIYGRVYNQLINHYKEEVFLNIKLALLEINPKILLLKSTIDPINRIWAYWASELGIKVICLQHGIFSTKAIPELMERDIVDFYISLGQKQAEIIEPVIPKYKHINFYESSNFICNLNKDTISVCFIGSDHERYSDKGKQNKQKILDIYHETIIALQKEKSTKYNFFYKMHPSETTNVKINSSVKIIKELDFKRIDIFFGIASSLLVQLSSLHKCAIQLRSKSLPLDNYQELGYCASIEIDKIKSKGLLAIIEENNTFPCLKEKSLSKIIASLLKLSGAS